MTDFCLDTSGDVFIPASPTSAHGECITWPDLSLAEDGKVHLQERADFFETAREIIAPRRTNYVEEAANRHLAKALCTVAPKDRAKLLVLIIEGAANCLAIIEGPDDEQVQSAKLMAAMLKDLDR